MAGRAARASTTIPPIRPRCSPSASDTPHTQPSPPRIRMLGYVWPRFHAAVNDLPAALLFVTVLFDLGAWVTKRDSLKSAAVWTLWAGVIGGWVAVLAGRRSLRPTGSDRRLGGRAGRPPGRRRGRARRSHSRADGDARDGGAHH